MATRSVIARKTEQGWSGVYHHWDGYPSGLGAHLWKLLRDRYAGDVERLLAEVVDAHPGGWSHLMEGDILTPRPGGHALGLTVRGRGPACYCHTYAEAEYPEATFHGCECRDPNVEDPSCNPPEIEWVYVFDPSSRTLEVLAAVPAGKNQAGEDRYEHRSVVTVDIDGPEPDWGEIEERVGAWWGEADEGTAGPPASH
jgi:hypothetical protein